MEPRNGEGQKVTIQESLAKKVLSRSCTSICRNLFTDEILEEKEAAKKLGFDVVGNEGNF